MAMTLGWRWWICIDFMCNIGDRLLLTTMAATLHHLLMVSTLWWIIDNRDSHFPCSVSFSSRSFHSSSTMEVNVILDQASSPCREAGSDDSMMSMTFSTPAQLTISRRPVVSPGLRKSSSKKKRLMYPTDEVVSTLISPSATVDVKEIPDLGYLPNPFDLGISRYLREIGPDVKPHKAVSPHVDYSAPNEPVMTASECPYVEFVCIDSLVVLAQQAEDIRSMTVSGVSALSVDESLPGSEFSIGVAQVPVPGSECGVIDIGKGNVVSIGDGVVMPVDAPSDIPFALDSDDHGSTIDFFKGSDDLFEMFDPLSSLADEDVNHLDIVNSDGDDETGNESQDNPDFCWFANASAEDLSVVQARGKWHSAKVEQWAARSFDEWRTFRGHSIKKSIADMSEELDVQPFVDLLVSFFLEVRKRDGTHYIPSTIANLSRAIGRLIRVRQKQRIIESSMQPPMRFQILSDVRYTRARIAVDQAVNHSSNAGLGKVVMKSDVVTLSEEAAMLNSPAADPLTASGLNARMDWYCGKNFFVRGGQELRDLNNNQFELVTDEFGDEGLRFKPGTCKNSKMDVLHCSVEQLRKPVTCLVRDVVETYKKIISKWPVYESVSEASNHPFFLTGKQRVSPGMHVWFTKIPVGRNQLSVLTKRLAKQIPSLKNKRISNKSARSTGISRMESALVPREQGMLTTGHLDHKSYEKYNQKESQCLSSCAMQHVLAGEILNGRPIMYSDALEQERERLDQLKRSNVVGALSIPLKSPSLAVTESISVQVKNDIRQKSVEKSTSRDVKSEAAGGKENVRPEEKVVTSSGRFISEYEDFVKWKMEQKDVVPKKQFFKEISSSGHVFSNVNNCQILVLNSDSGAPSVGKALDLLKLPYPSSEV